LRAGRKKDKDACYARLRQALLDAQNADTRLFEADIYIGRLRYITRRSGFTIPSYSTRHRDPPSPVLIRHEDEELDSLSGSITIIADWYCYFYSLLAGDASCTTDLRQNRIWEIWHDSWDCHQVHIWLAPDQWWSWNAKYCLLFPFNLEFAFWYALLSTTWNGA